MVIVIILWLVDLAEWIEYDWLQLKQLKQLMRRSNLRYYNGYECNIVHLVILYLKKKDL